MSDDTPTQRFPSSDSGDTPTQRLDTGGVQEHLQDEKQKSRGLLIGLIIAGALLLTTIIVLVAILTSPPAPGPLAGDTASPTPDSSVEPTPDSATPDATPGEPEPAETEAPPAPPQSTAAEFTTFNPKKQVTCQEGGPFFTPDPIPVRINWATIRADSAWIVQGTSDAADSGFMQIPLNGSQADFQYVLEYPCPQNKATYNITLVGSDGHHVSKSWTVTNVGFTP